MTELPVESAIPRLKTALDRERRAVLVAAPGAGKTTIVPLRLKDEPWLEGRKIVMLEPRRLAARAAARRLAANRAEAVGAVVGYRVRFDTVVSARTRIEVVTEGVLTRLLESDPGLEDYGLVIFDEFHERSIHADLGLALALQAQTILRPDLRLLVMSATIDAGAVARVLESERGPAPVIEAAGRIYPVETRYRPPRPDQRLPGHVAGVVRDALEAESGDVLVFLPGVGEIRRVEAMLTDPPIDARILPLYGTLPVEAQDAVFATGASRKVVLATSIAETSVTIPGIRVVIDGGQMRVPRFSPRTGMSRLDTVRVTRASADQRRGRAGRTEPGVCYRLWTEADEVGFLAFNQPEILASDLAPLALDLAAAGVRDPADLRWIDPPPAAPLAQAADLLRELGAIDPAGRLTAEGRAMARLPLHPRIAHLVVRAEAAGLQSVAALLAALLGERDPVRRPPSGELPDVDLRIRLDAMAGAAPPLGIELDRSALQRLRQEAREWRRRLGATGAPADSAEAGRVLAWAYPDRIAARRSGFAGRFLLRNGRGASVPANQPLARADYLVAVELDDVGPESRILLAAALEPEIVAELAAREGVRAAVISWDDESESVRAVERLTLGAIGLEERPAAAPDPEQVARVLRAAIVRKGIDALPWSDGAIRLRQRLQFLHRQDPADWPDRSTAALVDGLQEWLEPRLTGIRSFAELRARVDLGGALRETLSARQRAELERLAPDRWVTPAGSSLAIDYSDPAAPALAVRIQELFGLADTPRIAGGRVPLTLELLSPARRPVQITRDLRGFWASSYFDVRKDMKGRYPKHPWPDNPLEAAPRRGR
jgi:ATP-dependent RNA helicase HrpB